jgi:hypothetical protein
MSADLTDSTQWPLVDAVFLFWISGCEAVAGVPLPDGSVPVGAAGLSGVRLMLDQWDDYRALCRARGAQLVAL